MGVEQAAVAVGGVLVDAQVGDEDHLVTHLSAQVREGLLHDAGGIPGAGALRVFRGGHAEEHDCRDA